MNWRPWNKDLERARKREEETKEEVERRLTYLEAQVRVLKSRVEIKEQELMSG